MTKRKRSYSGRENRDKDKKRKRESRNQNKYEQESETVSPTERPPPSRIHQTSPDGNCFFNALSFVLTGTENHHYELRTNICNYISVHAQTLEAFLPIPFLNNGERYLKQTSMRNSGTWATETEIFAAAYMLNMNIYIYTKYGRQWSWSQHCPNQAETVGNIYLYHRNLNHYDVVLDIQEINTTKSNCRENQKRREKMIYQCDSTYRDRRKTRQKENYHKNPVLRDNVKERNRNHGHTKYHSNEVFKHKKMKASNAKYRTSETIRNKKKTASKEKYRQNLSFQQSVKDASKERYRNDFSFQQRVKEASRRKYRENLGFQRRVKNASRQKYQQNANFRKDVKIYSILKYKENKLFRQFVRASSLKRYASRPLFRYNLRKKLFQQYHNSPSIQLKKKLLVKERRKSLQRALKTFFHNIKQTPVYPCIVCARKLYKSQVKSCKRSKYLDGKYPDNAKKCMIGQYTCDSKEWICTTCDRHLTSGNIPPQALANGLHLTPLPEQLSTLNTLERQLVALRIPFMKLLSLPKGGQKGVKGQIVNVPSNINSVTSSLPRTIHDAQMVKVKLKRKLSYKGHHQYEWVNPTKVVSAVKYLVQNNLWYSNIAFNDNWFDSNNDSDLIRTDAQNDSTDEEDSNEEIVQAHPVETCSQPLDLGQEYLDTNNNVLCVAPGENQTPQSIFEEKGADTMAFPSLFPDGKYGFFQERPVKLSPTKYFNARLFCADDRFAKDNQYIFYAQFMIEMNNIKSNISIALRKGKGVTDDGKKVTASMLKDAENLQQILKSDSGFRFLQPVRGSPPYWQRTMKDLYAMIRQLGIPTWFVTFSAGETRWDETMDALKPNNDKRATKDIEWTEKCHIIRENPVMCARLFNNRVQRLFTDLIMSPAKPIGDVMDYFYRVEFQQRGSPHIHCLVWVKNAPKLEESSEEEICNFVDKYISCRFPEKERTPKLYEIVKAVQVHSKSHTKSCKKNSTTCRFNFPRPPIKQTFIATVAEEKDSNVDAECKKMPTPAQIDKMCKEATAKSSKNIVRDVRSAIDSVDNVENVKLDDILKSCNVKYSKFVESLKATATRNSIFHKRNLSDAWVNNYNPTLLRAWNANMDIQYVMDPYSCVAYILSYISKAEAEIGELLAAALKESREGNKDAASAMKDISHVYIQNREVSAQEAIYRVCSLHLKECSRQVVFIPTGNDAFKMSLPLTALKSRKGNSEDIWMKSIIDKYYARPDTKEFDDQCLAEFCSCYSIYPASRAPKATNKLPVFELQENLGYIKKRKAEKTAVIRYPRFNRLKYPNKYYLTLLQLYVPHRGPIEKPDPFQSFEEYVQHAKRGKRPVLETINQNRILFEKNVEELEKAWDDIQEGRIGEDAWAALAPESETERLTLQNEKVHESTEEEGEVSPDIELLATSEKQKSIISGVIEYQRPKSSAKEVQTSLRNMNEMQRKVFYHVREWVFNVAWKKHPDSFHTFVTGGAGTGKSHLIKCIYHETTRILSKTVDNPDALTVLITAPTGTAAFNIGGMTLHSAFSISKNIKLPYTPLGENILNSLRTKYEHLELLIIDEISMVDHKLLTYIHGRLCQIKQSKKVFGNVSILAVGDFYQLPPVKASPLYKIKDSVMMDLWNPFFHIATLTEIMRQKEDAQFASLLNRLRIRVRGQPMPPQDIDMLKSVSYDNEPDEAKTALHIYSTNKEVAAYNDAMVMTVCSPCVSCFAKDYTRNTVSGSLVQRCQSYSSASPEDLPDVIHLGINARVMLTRNIDTEDGLVNGAFGTVTAIDHPQKENIIAIFIKFDNEAIGRKIRSKTVSQLPGSHGAVRITPFEDSLAGKNAMRRQFPLKLGWAATIHKVQGMTTKRVVVSLKKIFQPGMAYVALSRTTALEGLHIVHLDIECIYASVEIKNALESMPKLFPEHTETQGNFCRIALHNTEGLLPHIKDIEKEHIFTEAHVICFTETWLTKNEYIPHSLFPNSTVHSVPRENAYSSEHSLFSQLACKSRGGVAIFSKKKEHIIYNPGVRDLEYAAIILQKPISALIVVVYRPPVYPLSKFKEIMTILLSRIDEEISLPVIILGDFNANANVTKPLLESTFTKYDYHQLVEKPTTESGTCLDLVLVKGFAEFPEVTVTPLYYGFHDAVSVLCKI